MTFRGVRPPLPLLRGRHICSGHGRRPRGHLLLVLGLTGVVLLGVATMGFVATTCGYDVASADAHASLLAAGRSAGGTLRRGLLLQGLSSLALVAEVARADDAEAEDMADFFCSRCCARDWCRCDCNCHAALKAQGYNVPSDATTAYRVSGKTAWPAAVGWRNANIPSWSPVSEDQIEVRDSLFEGAGKGLFARQALPKGTVLPPYRGPLLTFSEVQQRMRSPNMRFMWCPRSSSALLKNMSAEELQRGPISSDLAFCVDGQAADGNPASYVNSAKQSDQCKAVNVEICELGQVMYMRTTDEVAAGTELVTNYGSSYWKDFSGC